MATFTVQRDPSRRLIRVTFVGATLPEDHAAAMDLVGRTAGEGEDILVDLREAQVNLSLSANAELAERRLSQNRATVIVVGDDLAFGSASQFARFVETRGGGPIEVVRGVEEGLRWLETIRSERAAQA